MFARSGFTVAAERHLQRSCPSADAAHQRSCPTACGGRSTTSPSSAARSADQVAPSQTRSEGMGRALGSSGRPGTASAIRVTGTAIGGTGGTAPATGTGGAAGRPVVVRAAAGEWAEKNHQSGTAPRASPGWQPSSTRTAPHTCVAPRATVRGWDRCRHAINGDCHGVLGRRLERP